MATSTAKLAQGTTLSIQTSTPTSLTITAATKANPCVLTCTNTRAVGDVIQFPSGGLTGMPEIGGRVGIVTAATGTSLTVNIDASGFAAAATGGTASAINFNTIANVKNFNGFTGSVSEIDVSHLQSDAKEFNPGLEDFGGFTFNCDYDPTNAGQLAFAVGKANASSLVFKLNYPKATNCRAFVGFAKKFEEAGQVDGVLQKSAEIRITGRVAMQEVVV